MTFVAAKRFGDRILMAADTMISDHSAARNDVIPGRLKAIILDPQTTIAFAGLRDQSIDAIKHARRLLSEGGTLSIVEQALVAATVRYAGQLEFLLVSHREGVALKRVWDGHVSSGLDEACIGQRDLLERLLSEQCNTPRHVVPHEFEDEAPFSSAFWRLFNGIHISEDVGGFGITLTCSPYGHCYNGFGGVTAWDTITVGHALTEQQLADRRSGMTQWGYNIQGSKLRGIGVVGAIIPDAGIGYIYSPFSDDRPIEWRFQKPISQDQHGPILEQFQKRIDEVADIIGGGIDVTFAMPQYSAPNEAELELIAAHAANAPMPTAITLYENAVTISCGTAEAWDSVRVDFSSLDFDPVRVLTITIDRLNEEVLKRVMGSQ